MRSQLFINRDYRWRDTPETKRRDAVRWLIPILLIAFAGIGIVVLAPFSPDQAIVDTAEAPQPNQTETAQWQVTSLNRPAASAPDKSLIAPPLQHMYPAHNQAQEMEQAPAALAQADAGPPTTAKPESQPTPTPAESAREYKTTRVTVRKGDSLARIFNEQGLSAKTLHEILQLGKIVAPFKRLHPGQSFDFTLDQHNALRKINFKMDTTKYIEVHLDTQGYSAKLVELPVDVQYSSGTGIIESSLFLAAQKAGLSDQLTMELAGIFGWDIDFVMDIRSGDQFTYVHEEIYVEGEKVRNGKIISASFQNQGKTYYAIRYTDADGHTDFYTPDGHSMRKAFLRNPVPLSRISSRFNLKRKHPILNRFRAHKGVDYAAPRGTPIKATGDGKVIHRGKKGGYGNTVIVQHGQRYTTLYAHMSRYNKKLKVGSRVRQGQTLGYIGSSGLATGPHLHYEFRLDGVHRNPLTVRLPAARPINEKYKTEFLAYAKQEVAKLDSIQRNMLALNQ